MKVKNGLAVGVILAMALATQAAGVGWRNLDEANRLGGRKASEGYLQGKVVLVYKGGGHMARMEAVWQSFKSKSFVLIGAGREKNAACTFPMYEGAGLAADEPGTSFYVVSETGKVVYKGEDERQATESVVTALTDLDSPRSSLQWREFLNFELENLPAHAYLRFAEFKRKYPAEAKGYEGKVKELRAVKGVDKVADLVRFAKQAKDTKVFDPKKQSMKAKFAQSVKAAISKYAALKDVEDPRLAQEAKNSLADLKWALAAL